MFCIKCGQQLGEGSKFCFVCGAQTQTNDKKKNENLDKNSPSEVRADNYNPQDTHTHEGSPEIETTTIVIKQRQMVITLSVIALLAIIVTIAIILNRRSSDYPQTPTGITQIEDPAVRYEVSIYHIDRVFYGYLDNYPGLTVGAAFAQYFADSSWTHFLNGAIHYVSFTGTTALDGINTPTQILFRFTADDASFNATGLFFSGIWQDAGRLHGLLDSVFENFDS